MTLFSLFGAGSTFGSQLISDLPVGSRFLIEPGGIGQGLDIPDCLG